MQYDIPENTKVSINCRNMNLGNNENIDGEILLYCFQARQ